MATLGIAPRDGARFVAHQVTGAALETLLVVEQDAAIVGGYKQLGRARPNAGLGGAAFANLGVDGDVRRMRNTKVDGFHTIVEAQRSLGSLGRKRGNLHATNLEPSPWVRRTWNALRAGHEVQ
jgi:hypothetical protein